MNSTAIFWPAILQALVTLWMYVPMSKARIGAVKTGKAKVSDFGLPDKDEPAESRQKVNALNNQYELPVLFFAVVLSAYVTDTADLVMVLLAWLFAISKTVHSYVHATTNPVGKRRKLFMVPFFTCIVMWLWFATRLAIG